jgi:signal transduction histidine kinase
MGKFRAAFLSLLLIVHAPSFAEERGTRDEAKVMAEKAGQFLAANGKEKAFAAFGQGSNGFKSKDLYVFAYDDAGNCVAHGANPALVGKSLIGLKDVDGKPLVAEIVAVKATGWVDYKWKNPESGAIEAKHAFVVRVQDIVVGVGAYDK